MASGVKVCDHVKELYDAMKVVKNDADQKERIRLVVFEICNGEIAAAPGKTFREKDLEGKDVYEVFVQQMDPKKPCYMLYDCHFETKECCKKEELVFVMWAPDTASIKEKMQYASSKDCLKKILTGIKHELQLNDNADSHDKCGFLEKIGKGAHVINLEGHSV
ncbi:non-muscle cofilin 1-like [Embiotoca jacksoni]|uniref:non-muscle cofilin 1-like n=1 Tax=Embiotoca jacksoni TaxID=100190 RepID=UPI003703A7EE